MFIASLDGRTGSGAFSCVTFSPGRALARVAFAVCLFAMVGGGGPSLASGSSGSAIERIQGEDRPEAEVPVLYGSWNRVLRGASWKSAPGATGEAVSAGTPVQEEGTAPSETPGVAYVGAVIGMGLLMVMAYLGFSRRGVIRVGGERRRGPVQVSRSGESRAQGGEDAPETTRARVDWSAEQPAHQGAVGPMVAAPPLEGPAPTPEEMRRHLGELLGKVQGAKPLAKRNSDEF